ncbi:hypothetical protein D3C71_1648970 [compost metagenome]
MKGMVECHAEGKKAVGEFHDRTVVAEDAVFGRSGRKRVSDHVLDSFVEEVDFGYVVGKDEGEPRRDAPKPSGTRGPIRLAGGQSLED